MTADPKTTMAVGFGGSTYSWLQLPWADVAAFLTVVFVCIQIVNLLPTVWAKFRNWRAGKGWKE